MNHFSIVSSSVTTLYTSGIQWKLNDKQGYTLDIMPDDHRTPLTPSLIYRSDYGQLVHKHVSWIVGENQQTPRNTKKGNLHIINLKMMNAKSGKLL